MTAPAAPASTKTVPDGKNDTIFGKILRKEVPCKFIYEDDMSVAFHDIAKQAPTHVIIIPKKHIPQLSKATDADAPVLGHLLLVANRLAKELKLDDGFRIVINDGKHAGQTVFHLHVHLLAGRAMGWPPG